jgi:hypothetical protein
VWATLAFGSIVVSCKLLCFFFYKTGTMSRTIRERGQSRLADLVLYFCSSSSLLYTQPGPISFPQLVSLPFLLVVASSTLLIERSC